MYWMDWRENTPKRSFGFETVFFYIAIDVCAWVIRDTQYNVSTVANWHQAAFRGRPPSCPFFRLEAFLRLLVTSPRQAGQKTTSLVFTCLRQVDLIAG
jgi:hypothetical protein